MQSLDVSNSTTALPTPAEWRPTFRPDGVFRVNPPFGSVTESDYRHREFHAFRESLFAELVPSGVYEYDLAEDVVNLRWRLLRTLRYESEVINGHRRLSQQLFDQALENPDDAASPELRQIAKLAVSCKQRIKLPEAFNHEERYRADETTLAICFGQFEALGVVASPAEARNIRAQEAHLRRSLAAAMAELRRARKDRGLKDLKLEQRAWREHKIQEVLEFRSRPQPLMVASPPGMPAEHEPIDPPPGPTSATITLAKSAANALPNAEDAPPAMPAKASPVPAPSALVARKLDLGGKGVPPAAGLSSHSSDGKPPRLPQPPVPKPGINPHLGMPGRPERRPPA